MALQDARNNLVLKATDTEIKALENRMASYKEEDYTASSWKDFDLVLNEIKEELKATADTELSEFIRRYAARQRRTGGAWPCPCPAAARQRRASPRRWCRRARRQRRAPPARRARRRRWSRSIRCPRHKGCSSPAQSPARCPKCRAGR